MATRSRQSTVQPTPRASRPGTTQVTPARSIEAPPYEQPSFPLNPNAQRALANLKRSHDLQKLTKSIVDAQITLTEAADDINQRLTVKREKLESQKEKVQKRREQDESLEDDDDHIERQQDGHDRMEKHVTNMTKRMEETMRQLTDAQEYVSLATQSLETSAEDARNNASTQASTQNIRTQPPRRSTRENGSEDEAEGEDEEGDDIPDFEPTDPAASTQSRQAPIDVFKRRYNDSKIRYQRYSMHDRYSGNTAYVNYRRTVHDAAYPNDSVPLPPEHMWFNDDGTVAPVGYTKRPEEYEEDSDDDIAVSRATISTKCPLTLKEFENPLTSTKCDHSFEASAIIDMLHRSSQRLPAKPGQHRAVQAVQCPVTACSQMLSKDDLQKNVWLIRKIKRQQRAKQQAQEEDGDESEGDSRGGTQSGAQQIDSDDDDLMDVDNEPPTKLKTEPRATGASAASRSQQPPLTSQSPQQESIAIDLLEDENEDDNEDDDDDDDEDDDE